MTKFKVCFILSFFLFTKAIAQNDADTIDRFVQKFIQHYQIPGCAIAILKDNKIVKINGYGLASLEFNVPVTTKTKFLLDSQTKLFTAIAIMKLQEQEKIKLDDAISLYLDSVPASWHNVTIRNLLTHSSGIHDNYVPAYNDVSLMEYTEEQLYRQAIQQSLDFKTGERISYNNLGFFLATLIIEKVANVPYQNYMTDSLFAPLGLTDVSFASQEDVVENYATAYTLKNNKIVHMRDYAVSQQGYSYMMKASVEDLAAFDVLFNNEKVISKRSIDEMRKLFITTDNICKIEDRYETGFIGLAYEIWLINGYTAYFKTGGSGTIYMQIPALNLTVIMLSNLEQDKRLVLATDLARIMDKHLQNNLISNQTLKDKNSSSTEQMKLTFINSLSGKNDLTNLNQTFFLWFPHVYDQKKVVQQLTSFIYAGQYKMNDRSLILYGAHADEVIMYKAKLNDLDLLVFFYLSDNGKILFADAELNE